jgi:hypothetical protein
MSDKRLLPEKSAASTNDQSATELPSRRKNIFVLLGGAGVGEFGSTMRKKTGANPGAFTTDNFFVPTDNNRRTYLELRNSGTQEQKQFNPFFSEFQIQVVAQFQDLLEENYLELRKFLFRFLSS